MNRTGGRAGGQSRLSKPRTIVAAAFWAQGQFRGLGIGAEILGKLLAKPRAMWCNGPRRDAVPEWQAIFFKEGHLMSRVATPPTAQPSTAQVKIPHEKIAMRAYEKWCQRGRKQGTELQD